MTNKNFYVTTPIYYVNDIPHIGHAYTSLACDVISRFKKSDGYNTMFLTGTDEHGQKIYKSAISKSTTPQDLVDNISKSFKDLAVSMNFKYDDFIRTTEDRHKKSVIKLWNKLYKNGHIYKDNYEGWYSISDEMFILESEVKTLENGTKIAPTGSEVTWMKEESYFFNLSKWQKPLLDFYKNNKNFIQPKSRYNEVVSFVERGLNDLSISRNSFDWGIKVPCDDKHVVYVWLDALTNYISALDFKEKDSKKFKSFWPADFHIVGKDILRFHAIYWPAFLMAADIELPKTIFAHGWWTNEGEKISKSKGNAINPLGLVDEFGLDQVRYFLLREMRFGKDGDFARGRLINRINTELANDLGNLSQRVLSMIFKNCNGEIPKYSIPKKEDNDLLVPTYQLLEKVKIHLETLAFNEALKEIFSIVKLANSWIDSQAPWKLKTESKERMESVLYVLAESIRNIALLLMPFMPQSMEKMLDQLNIKEEYRNFYFFGEKGKIEEHIKIQKPTAIFPKYNI